MKLKSFNYLYCLLIIFLYLSPLNGEEKIDIWKNNKNIKQIIDNDKISTNKQESQQLNLDSIKKIELNQNIKIEDKILNENTKEARVFGIYDPEDNDFNLNMWSSTNADDIKASLKRLEKIKLSKTANQILERILLSFSYAPKGISEDGFAKIKIDWMIKN